MKKLIFTTLISLSFGAVFGQNLRTFNNIELGSSLSENVNQYALYYGESIQLAKPIPIRFSTGLRLAFNNVQAANYRPDAGDLRTLTFNKDAWYTSVAIPIGAAFHFKAFSFGAFQEIISLSGNKSYGANITPLGVGESVKTLGFSSVFDSKNNLTGGVFAVYTVKESFSFKVGVNRISSTFNKSGASGNLGYAKFINDAFTFGLRINIEK